MGQQQLAEGRWPVVTGWGGAIPVSSAVAAGPAEGLAAAFLDWGRTAGAALAGPGPVASVAVQRVAVEAVGVVAASARAVVVGREVGLVGPEAAGRALSALAAAQASWLGLVGWVDPSPGGGEAGAVASRRLRQGLAAGWCAGDARLPTRVLAAGGDMSGLLVAQSVGLAVVARVAVAVFTVVDRESRRAGVLAGRLVATRRIVGTSAAAWGAVRDALAPVLPGGPSTARAVRR
nr:hypothetical protein [Propionibacterium sp.]